MAANTSDYMWISVLGGVALAQQHVVKTTKKDVCICSMYQQENKDHQMHRVCIIAGKEQCDALIVSTNIRPCKIYFFSKNKPLHTGSVKLQMIFGQSCLVLHQPTIW